MGGIPGPIPKRSDERRRTNKTTESGAPSQAEVVQISDRTFEDSKLVPAPEPNEDWHEVARMQWDAALSSGQRIFYEPTDWAQLYLLCEELSLEMQEKVIGFSEKNGELVYASQPIVGAKITALMKGFASLMFMEGDRRKLRLELERGAVKDPAQTKPGDVVAFRKSRLG
jgi:hypothetical protein